MTVIARQLVLTTVQKPQQQKNNQQCRQEKDDAPVTMEISVQEPRVDAGSKHGDGEDSKPILGNRKRNRRRDHRGFPPKRPQEQMRQHHARYNQHQARSHATAFLCDLKRKPRYGDHDAILRNWNAES